VQVITLDATDTGGVRRALEGTSGVVNCVAGSTRSIVQGAIALASAVSALDKPPRVVHLSSLAVYGRTIGTVNESSALRGDLDEYSAAKVAAERALNRCPSVVMLRPGIVYGPNSPWWSDRIARLLVTRRLGDLGANGNGICNLLYVEDAVAAILRSLRTPAIAGGVFNLASNPAPTWNEFFRQYAEALSACPMRRISGLRLAFETGLISPVLKLAEVLARARTRDLPPAIRPWLLDRCRHAIRMDVGRAESALGMQWTPLDLGLRETAKWFRGVVGHDDSCRASR
jgi:nucleoside-diphosphate-sugar epimerase